MRAPSIVAAGLLLACSPMVSPHAGVCGPSGFAEVEGRVFPEAPRYEAQGRDSASIAAQPEYYREFAGGSIFSFVPFARLDSADSARSHADIRELSYLHLAGRWELRLGISKVFWGVTESQQLVDIVNQTDLVEDPDGDEKLGQPMAHLSLPGERGVADIFVLPWFRERTFPGKGERLRGPLAVDTAEAGYESGARQRHVDLAFRYGKTIGPLDMGVSYFRGTGREPTLVLGENGKGETVLSPLYELVRQAGLEALFVSGAWLWKAEAIYRAGQGDRDYYAHTLGVEYARPSAFGSAADIGLLAEWLYDARGNAATTPFERDLMLGLRIAMNDAAGSEALADLIRDIDGRGSVLSLEASRRAGSRIKLLLEAFMVLDSKEGEALHYLRDDDFAAIKMRCYF